jgi:Cysteine-rich CPCC
MAPPALHQCPCCDYFTLDAPHDWDVCEVCYWEDGDGSDLNNPDVPSGCNHGLTLRTGRENFRRIGACEPEMLEHVLPPEARSRYRHAPRALR